MDELEILRCEWCGREMRRGRREPVPRYCGSACRVAAHRVRRTTAAIHAELDTAGAARTAIVHRAPTLAASSDEQVARAFVEAHALGGVFGRPSLEARSQLAVRCTHVAEALTLAIGRRHQWRWVQMAPSMTGIRAVWRLAHE